MYSPSKFKNSLFFNVTFDHCTVHFFFLLSVLKFCKMGLAYKIQKFLFLTQPIWPLHCASLFFFLLFVLKCCKKGLVYKIRNSSICKYFWCDGKCNAFKPLRKQTIKCDFFSDAWTVWLSQFSHNAPKCFIERKKGGGSWFNDLAYYAFISDIIIRNREQERWRNKAKLRWARELA